MTSHAIKGSDIFIRALENEGVEYVFGVPGEENLDMLESLRTSRIKVVRPGFGHDGGTSLVRAAVNTLNKVWNAGIDLRSRSEHPRDRWCLCALHWQEAFEAGKCPPWFYAPLTKVLWTTARSPISNASQWT